MKLSWIRRLFDCWTDFFEYLVFLSACTLGLFHASWLWISIGAMVLLLLRWSRWEALFTKAAAADAEWRELGWLTRALKAGSGLDLYARAYKLPLVVAAKLGHDFLFVGGAFAVGYLIAWAWAL
jgi:hypothetical protein